MFHPYHRAMSMYETAIGKRISSYREIYTIDSNLPISGVIIIYMADIGEPDILLQIFYLSILRLICNSLSKAMAPIVYPYTFLSQGVSLRRAVQKPDRK